MQNAEWKAWAAFWRDGVKKEMQNAECSRRRQGFGGQGMQNGRPRRMEVKLVHWCGAENIKEYLDLP